MEDAEEEDDSEAELEAALLAPSRAKDSVKTDTKWTLEELAFKMDPKRATAMVAAAIASAAPHGAPAAAAAAASAASDAPTPARLTLSSLTPHLILFPSHKHDPVYTDSGVAVEERKTSFELSSAEELAAALACPVVMNTPEFMVNHPKERSATIEHKSNESGVDGTERRSRSTTVPALGGAASAAAASSSSSAAAAAYPVHPSPPAFLLSSSLLPFGDDELDASFRRSSGSDDQQEGPARSGFVQCVKCQKWRTVSPYVETRESVDSARQCKQQRCRVNGALILQVAVFVLVRSHVLQSASTLVMRVEHVGSCLRSLYSFRRAV